MKAPAELFGPVQPYRCAWGRVCVHAEVLAELDPETGRPVRLGAPVVDPPLCQADWKRLESAVKELPRDYARLQEGLGERRAVEGAKVTMSAEPPVNLNVHREMLQSLIVEIADRAADVVEEELRMTGVGRHRQATPRGFEGRGYRAAGAKSTGSALVTIDRAVKLLLPSLDALVDAPAQAHMVWLPLPDSDEECDRHPKGQPRELVELSGLDIAWRIVRISSDVYVELGRNRLRYRFAAPCPAWITKERRWCGASTVGRDNGSSFVDCETCGAKWTEDEYRFLEGLILGEIEEREEHDLLKYLLAEAYWRLDQLRERTQAPPPVDADSVRTIIAAAVAEGGSSRAAERAVELVELISGHITGQLSAVLDIGAPDAEGNTVSHSLPPARDGAARDHERTKQDKAKQRRQELVKR